MRETIVRLNMAVSVDGKITTIEGDKLTFGSQEDRKLMEKLRIEADCIIVGANNVKVEDTPLILRDEKLKNIRVKRKGLKQPINVVVSTKLDFVFKDSAFFNNNETKKVIFTKKRINADKVFRASKYADVIKVESKNGKLMLVEVIKYLKEKYLCRNILVEGGGDLNFSMFSENLIDEIYITVCPYIFGGRDVPTAITGIGFNKSNIKKLKLLSVRKSDFGELFLKYKVLKQKVIVKSNLFSKRGSQIFYN